MPGETGGGLGGFQLGVAEDLATHGGECGIVVDQSGAGVDVVMIVIVFAIIIEPRLHALGKILVVDDAGVFAPSEAGL